MKDINDKTKFTTNVDVNILKNNQSQNRKEDSKMNFNYGESNLNNEDYSNGNSDDYFSNDKLNNFDFSLEIQNSNTINNLQNEMIQFTHKSEIQNDINNNFIFQDKKETIKEEKTNVQKISSRDIGKKRKRENEIKNRKRNKKRKTNGENKEIKKTKILFTIEKNDKNTRIGKKTEKKSRRRLNIYNKLFRNFIQDIIPNWINFGENEKKKKLYKLNPNILKKTNNYKFKNKLLKEIYSQEITSKEYDKEHNIKIIQNAEGIKKIKLELYFEETVKFFSNKSLQKDEIIKILKYKKSYDEKINIDEFLNGLEGKEEYIHNKGGNSSYKIKFKESLEKFENEFFE